MHILRRIAHWHLPITLALVSALAAAFGSDGQEFLRFERAAIANGEIDLMFNTTEGEQAIRDSFTLRRAALLNSIPYYTTVAGAKAAVQAILCLKRGNLEVAPLQSYF